MESARLQQLQSRIAELRRLLLPHKFDATGTYSQAPRVRARALSFRVLSHAELESYFEDRVVEIAKTALKEWKRRGFVSRVTLHLVGFSGREMPAPPDTLAAPTDNKKKTWPEIIAITDRVEKAVSEYVYRVTKENHGIKERNILTMLLPIGFAHERFDQLLLTNLNQFGEERGLIAHSSGAAYVTQSVDPRDEYERLRVLLRDLAPVDEELNLLLVAAGHQA